MSKPKSNDAGMCVDCKEYCEIGEPCCNGPVFFEGSTYWPEECQDFEDNK